VDRIELNEGDALEHRASGARGLRGLRRSGWIAAGVAAAAIVAAIYFGRQALFEPREPPPVVATKPPIPAEPAAQPSAAPAERYPIAGVKSDGAAAQPLPPPNESDGFLRGVLTGLVGAGANLFPTDEIARRFVVTIDNLPRSKLAARLLPIKPAPGAFQVAGSGSKIATNPENDKRYAAYVAVAQAVDTHALVAAYVQIYPLLQEQYRALGYPSGHFNDRVVEAIDDLLAAPDVAGPVALIQPKVRYEFADPDLESRSAGQKIMMRLGGENEATMKNKLREIRAALVGSPPDHQ
jgi:hypothetical protein